MAAESRSTRGMTQGLAALSAVVVAGLLSGCKESGGQGNAKAATNDGAPASPATGDPSHNKTAGTEAAAAPVQSDPDADQLKAVMQSLRAAQNAGDGRKIDSLVRDLCPDESRIRGALRQGVDEGMIHKIVELRPGWQTLMTSDASYTEVKVVGATGQQIADGTGSGPEFGRRGPGVATTLLRPEMKYYTVEFTPPGQGLGQKFYFFFRDGDRWFMLGSLWQVLNAGVGKG